MKPCEWCKSKSEANASEIERLTEINTAHKRVNEQLRQDIEILKDKLNQAESDLEREKRL